MMTSSNITCLKCINVYTTCEKNLTPLLYQKFLQDHGNSSMPKLGYTAFLEERDGARSGCNIGDMAGEKMSRCRGYFGRLGRDLPASCNARFKPHLLFPLGSLNTSQSRKRQRSQQSCHCWRRLGSKVGLSKIPNHQFRKPSSQPFSNVSARTQQTLWRHLRGHPSTCSHRKIRPLRSNSHQRSVEAINLSSNVTSKSLLRRIQCISSSTQWRILIIRTSYSIFLVRWWVFHSVAIPRWKLPA